jgi:catechol 2,3-dioxygenase-like lactoylglutathione lyase family enzyme
VNVTVHGTHHTGVTVSSLDQMLSFLRELFGLVPLWILESDGPEVAAAVGLEHQRSRIALLELNDRSKVELIEYLEPGRPFDRNSNDVGSSHICFEVPDLEVAIERLTSAGATFFSSPMTIGSGGLEGWRFAYFREPMDGIVFELIQRPAADR